MKISVPTVVGFLSCFLILLFSALQTKGSRRKTSLLHSAFGNITANKNGILDRSECMIKGMACLTGRIRVIFQKLQ